MRTETPAGTDIPFVPLSKSSGRIFPTKTSTADTEKAGGIETAPEPKAEATSEPDEPAASSNTGAVAFVLLIALTVGGAGYYFKILRPKQEALARLRCLMRDIDCSFYKSFGLAVDDIRTVYAECRFHLVPREDERSVCLMDDWIYLPSA